MERSAEGLGAIPRVRPRTPALRGAATMRARLLLAAVAFLACGLAAAESRAQDVQIPLDENGSLFTLDAPQARELGLFGETPGFREARLYQAADSSVVLEVVSLRDGRILRERRPLADADLRALRSRVTAALLLAERAPGPERNSRSGFLIGSSLLALGYYSWGVPVGLGLEDRKAVGVGMLSAASGFFVPLILTRHETVTPAMTNLAIYGGTRGITYGLLLHEAIQDSADYDDDPAAGRGVLASVAAGTLGYFWARESGMSSGKANLIGVGGDTGILWGLGIAEFLDWNGVEDKEGERAALVLGTTAAGLAGGALFADHRSLGWGDTEVLRMAEILGAGIGATVVDVAGAEETDPHVTGAIAGSIAGLVAGDQLTKGTEFSALEAFLLDVGTVAGAALGLGIAYLADRGPDNSATYAAGASLGGVGAFTLCYRLLSPEARARAGAR